MCESLEGYFFVSIMYYNELHFLGMLHEIEKLVIDSGGWGWYIKESMESHYRLYTEGICHLMSIITGWIINQVKYYNKTSKYSL